MSSAPIVSVLLPVYNADRYVAQAVESILNQTFTDFELIIIDDGSTDTSLKILQTYASKDHRIRLLSRANRGLLKTLNQMIEMAKGKYLARMDADDIALPDRFAAQVALLEREPEVVCVGGSYDMIDEQGAILAETRPPITDAEIQQQLLAGFTVIQHPCAMFRRSALLAVSGYDESAFLAEDLDLWLRMGEIGKLANLEQVILLYRVHMRSVSRQNLKRQLRVVRKVCERAWKRRGVTGDCLGAFLWYHEFIIDCGWRAFNQSQRRECLSFGMQAVKISPLNVESWRLLICAAIKPLPPVTTL